MRVVRKFAAGLVLASMLLITLGFDKSCGPSKEQVLPWAKEIVGGLRDAEAIMTANGLNVSNIIAARNIAEQLVAQLEKPDDPTSKDRQLVLVANLISRFENLVTESTRISNPKTKTIVLVMLAVADVALRRVADVIYKGPAVQNMRTASPAMAKVAVFRSRPQWRCRSSQTGRFAKMEFCKEHPDISQVETYYQ